jgi:hypothetical protein
MLDATEEVGGIFIVTADHGNAEDMVKRNAKTGAPIKDKQGNYQILTAHTCAPVSPGLQAPPTYPLCSPAVKLFISRSHILIFIDLVTHFHLTSYIDWITTAWQHVLNKIQLPCLCRFPLPSEAQVWRKVSGSEQIFQTLAWLMLPPPSSIFMDSKLLMTTSPH